jgi:hypothetical protein
MLRLLTPTTPEDRPMPRSIRQFAQAVESLLTSSEVALPVRTRQRLVFFILGILLSGTLVLRRIATTHAYLTPQTTCAASHERRLRRVLNDPLLTWERSYARVVRRLLARQRPTRWVILVDETAQAEHWRVLTAALAYRGRAIPLAWVLWPAQVKQTTSYWARCATLLDQVAQVLPAGAAVVVVADRAFGCPVFTDPVTARGWDWLVRVQGQTRWRDGDGRVQPVRAQVAQPGDRWRGGGQVFKDAGWRTAQVLAVWGAGHREPLLLVASLGVRGDLRALYQRRAAIETLFRDWKSAGWQWEASQVRDGDHQARLLLGLACATLITLVLGTQAAAQATPAACGRQRWAWARRSSVFRLGREAFWQRVWRHDRTPIRWALEDLEGPNWSARPVAPQEPVGTGMAALAA